jgi:hypothetical protein
MLGCGHVPFACPSAWGPLGHLPHSPPSLCLAVRATAMQAYELRLLVCHLSSALPLAWHGHFYGHAPPTVTLQIHCDDAVWPSEWHEQGRLQALEPAAEPPQHCASLHGGHAAGERPLPGWQLQPVQVPRVPLPASLCSQLLCIRG